MVARGVEKEQRLIRPKCEINHVSKFRIFFFALLERARQARRSSSLPGWMCEGRVCGVEALEGCFFVVDLQAYRVREWYQRKDLLSLPSFLLRGMKALFLGLREGRKKVDHGIAVSNHLYRNYP
jgi:hypothetical protein